MNDPRRLLIPEPIASDLGSYELLSGWARNGKVSVMTRTGTGLDQQPEIWGEILVAIAENIALSIKDVTGANPDVTLATIKESLERHW
ncbi:MAG: DUF5076 domain-containing protein [Planctomycetia bacterium]|nr:DUF5076 domain-containing protein [Planctomycetia bacterium]